MPAHDRQEEKSQKRDLRPRPFPEHQINERKGRQGEKGEENVKGLVGGAEKFEPGGQLVIHDDFGDVVIENLEEGPPSLEGDPLGRLSLQPLVGVHAGGDGIQVIKPERQSD